MVHGASATGQTVFVEPFETVEINNQLVQLAEDEAAQDFPNIERTDGTRARTQLQFIVALFGLAI